MSQELLDKAPVALEGLRMAPAVARPSGSAMTAETARAVQEVQAALVIAKSYPRDEQEAYNRIMKACQRPTLAESGLYAYNKGGSEVTGASIRLAEAMAQAWGNIKFGWRVLTQNDEASEVEAFAWDMETNTPNTMTWTVPHSFKAKGQIKRVTDPRDVYELIANQASRRLRAVILRCIPGDIQDAAVEQCERTLKSGGGKPLADRVRDMILHFEQDLGVTKPMIEKRVNKKIEAINETEFVSLRKIFGSLRDGMSKADQWFDLTAGEQATSTAELKNAAESAAKAAPDAPPPPPSSGQTEAHSPAAPVETKQAEPNELTGNDVAPGLLEVLQGVSKAKTVDALTPLLDIAATLPEEIQKVALNAVNRKMAMLAPPAEAQPPAETKKSRKGGSLE